MIAVLLRELKSYFENVTGFIFMGFFLLLSGIFFVFNNLIPQSPNYNGVLGTITFIFLIVVPILTMRLLSEESRNKTDQLLLTSPLSLTGMVMGKYLSAVAVFLFTLIITFLYPLLLSFVGSIVLSEIIGGYIGFFLLGCAFIAVGLFVSSLTDNQVIAAVVTFAALLIMWIIDALQQGLPADPVSGAGFAVLLVLAIAAFLYLSLRNLVVSIATAILGGGVIALFYFVVGAKAANFEGFIVKVLKWFSLLERYQSFSLGVLGLSPVVYYVSFCAVFVFLTVRVIEKRRWQ
jgi:ABC-2 type transport system permease protein